MKRTSKDLGRRIRQARELLGPKVTIERLARAAKLAPERLTALEAGEGDAPTDDELARIADKLLRGAAELREGPLLPQSAPVVAQAQKRIGNSQGGRIAETSTDPEDRANLAANVRAYREASGMSQSQLGNLLGVATPNVSIWESPTGKYAPGTDTLRRMADLFGCTVADLTGPSRPVVVRAKMSGNLAEFSPERRAQLEREMAAFNRRMDTLTLEAIAAETKKAPRRR